MPFHAGRDISPTLLRKIAKEIGLTAEDFLGRGDEAAEQRDGFYRRRSMAGRWIFVIAFALVWYGNGAAFVESFVNYSSWHLIGSDEFVAYHRFIGPRVLILLVAPALLGTVFTVLMLWVRPAGIPSWAVWAAIAAQAIVWSSTATIQVPIQVQLSAHGRSLELIEQLIRTNFWLRRIPYAVCAALLLWMASRAIGVSGEKRAARQTAGLPRPTLSEASPPE